MLARRVTLCLHQYCRTSLKPVLRYMVLQCGAAVRDITPSQPVSLHGYATRNRFSEETPSYPDAPSEPIVLGCLCLDDGAQRVLIVTADMVGISSSVCAELYSLLHEAVGITFPNVLLSCSHTHFAPALQVADCHPLPGPLGNEPDPRFVADFQRKLVEAAKEAVEMLQPVTMETARVRAGALSYNRRWRTTDGKVTMHLQYPLDKQRKEDPTLLDSSAPVDDMLTVWRFRAAAPATSDQQPTIVAALLNWGCHPVTGGRDLDGVRDFYRISADYVRINLP